MSGLIGLIGLVMLLTSGVLSARKLATLSAKKVSKKTSLNEMSRKIFY